LLNIEGYFDPLLAFLDRAVQEEFLTPDTLRHLVVFERLNYLLEYLEQNLSLNDDFLEEKA
jgi:predicted Rossmann-fold nucleotide-binding protein